MVRRAVQQRRRRGVLHQVGRRRRLRAGRRGREGVVVGGGRQRRQRGRARRGGGGGVGVDAALPAEAHHGVPVAAAVAVVVLKWGVKIGRGSFGKGCSPDGSVESRRMHLTTEVKVF